MITTLAITLILCTLLGNTNFIYSADYSAGPSSLKPEFSRHVNDGPKLNNSDPLGLRAEAVNKFKKSLQPRYAVSDENFANMLMHFRTDLPSTTEAGRRIDQLVQNHPRLRRVIRCMKDAHLFNRANFPSRLLFVGPSGCGKTITAKSLAVHCNTHCVFVKGSSVGNTYQNSGATLINDLFEGLLERTDQLFVVVIDEIMAVAKCIDDSKEMQQNKTAMAFWQALDDCKHKRHICIIGTDNGDPEKLAPQLKTRFGKNVFVFRHGSQNEIVNMIKECLDDQLDETTLTDAYLNQLAQLLKKISKREIEDFIDEAKMIAIDESDNPNAQVTRAHLEAAYQIYRDPSWMEKIWTNRQKHITNLVSARAVSLYMVLGGTAMQAFSKDFRRHGVALIGLGAILNHYWPKDEKEASDLPLFSTISHLFAQDESHTQWETSHQLNVRNSDDSRSAHSKSIDVARQQLDESKRGNAIARDNLTLAIRERAMSEGERKRQALLDIADQIYNQSGNVNKAAVLQHASHEFRLYLEKKERLEPVEQKNIEKYLVSIERPRADTV